MVILARKGGPRRVVGDVEHEPNLLGGKEGEKLQEKKKDGVFVFEQNRAGGRKKRKGMPKGEGEKRKGGGGKRKHAR